MSKHKFKLVKTFDIADIPKDIHKSLTNIDDREIIPYRINDNIIPLNKWLIEHDALLNETVFLI